jgi:hypothetical protein
MFNLNDTVAIAISQPLNVKPSEILRFVKISVGDKVNKQTTLAKKKSLFGIGGIELHSPVVGLVNNIDLEKGTILIKIEDTKLKLNSPEAKKSLPIQEKKVKLKSVNPNTKFKRTASSSKNIIDGVFGCGRQKGIGWTVEYDFNQRSIIPEMEGKILLIKQLPSLSEIFKASTIGILAIVVSANDIEASNLEKIKVQLSGKSHLAFLVLPGDCNLATLHNVLIDVDGENQRLIVPRK